ncbi:MAG: ATP-dependent DNA ligase [Candidatus Bathyarchaeota archaeon]|jgi:DNA ligase-1|nr:ATP-dependent DNA ligase [Candidatus Bathyarchaeota archaeon A05DMB-5]MDH7557669.1 ATP-dependent DNA ligase [Candidatus Bathyarchaeota archaeon]
MSTSFKALAELGEKLEATTKRLEMIDLVSDFLKNLEPQEVEPAISMLLGRAFPKWSPRTPEVSWATLSGIIKRIAGIEWSVFSEAFRKTGDVGSATKIVFEESKVKRQATLFERTLTILEVRRSLESIAEVSGYGSREKKERLIESLLSLASPLEAKYLIRIFISGMRTGFYEGLMEQAVSKAFQIPLEAVQKASMTLGDIGEVAAIAKTEGKEGLTKISFKVFRPVSLMLAQMAKDIAEALKEHGGKTAFEYKLDGARVQIHKLGDDVRIFSRRLTDVTESLPEIVEMTRKNVSTKEVILEGEVIAVDASGNPIPFQHLMRRFRRVHAVEDMTEKLPVKLYLFDILYLNGESLITLPYLRRRQILTENAGEIPLTKQLITDKTEEAERFLKEAIDAGHEGLMAKKPDSPYTPGIRGKRWLKIKPVLEPLDLAIVAAEYGYGRRREWLSDYYLAARDTESGEFLTVGKTFKGLTDEEFAEITRRLKELAVKKERGRVVVVPKIVVEVTYNEIQKSPKYKCGMALRFARINRIRYDKAPEEADTIQKVREIYERQFLKKGRYKAE